MEIQTFELQGLKLLKLKKFSDDRGFFTERFRKEFYAEIGCGEFIQENFSSSKHRVLRGLHYQWEAPQGKLVTCTRGTIVDAVVDIRKDSPTFGKHQAVTLSGDNPAWFWVPAGFAHGFAVLSEEGADVMYKVDNYWNPKAEGCIVWNDPQLGINWQVQNPLLSGKDQLGQSFAEYSQAAKF